MGIVRPDGLCGLGDARGGVRVGTYMIVPGFRSMCECDLFPLVRVAAGLFLDTAKCKVGLSGSVSVV